MAGCATCLHKNVHPNVCSDCLCGTHFTPRKITNAQRIRTMTDEELAEWIRDQIIDRNIGIPSETWLNWLKQEAK